MVYLLKMMFFHGYAKNQMVYFGTMMMVSIHQWDYDKLRELWKFTMGLSCDYLNIV